MSQNTDYEKVFLPNFTDTMETPTGEHITIPFHTVRIGELNLQQETVIDIHGVLFPSERISLQFCPVDIAIMEHDILRGDRVACVRIICKHTEPIRFDFAKGYYPARPDHLLHEVRVDSGMLQIADPRFQETAQSKEDFKASLTVHNEETLWSKTSVDSYEAFDIKTAYGDGTFLVYAGYDAQGSVCRIVCDFVAMQ